MDAGQKILLYATNCMSSITSGELYILNQYVNHAKEKEAYIQMLEERFAEGVPRKILDNMKERADREWNDDFKERMEGYLKQARISMRELMKKYVPPEYRIA
jgi:hypothetical protein